MLPAALEDECLMWCLCYPGLNLQFITTASKPHTVLSVQATDCSSSAQWTVSDATEWLIQVGKMLFSFRWDHRGYNKTLNVVLCKKRKEKKQGKIMDHRAALSSNIQYYNSIGMTTLLDESDSINYMSITFSKEITVIICYYYYITITVLTLFILAKFKENI